MVIFEYFQDISLSSYIRKLHRLFVDFASEDETQCEPCGKIFRGNKQSEKKLWVTLKDSSEKSKRVHQIDVASKGQKAEIQRMRERVKIY